MEYRGGAHTRNKLKPRFLKQFVCNLTRRIVWPHFHYMWKILDPMHENIAMIFYQSFFIMHSSEWTHHNTPSAWVMSFLNYDPLITSTSNIKKRKKKKNNTRDSNVVPHRSTNLARSCLTSLSRREAVLSWLYGRSWKYHHNQRI